MYTLTKTQFYGTDAFRIEFDEWESFSSFGPFFDILALYAEETGISPTRVQLVYQYRFTEEDRKIQFYWDANSYVYIFDIPSFLYQKVCERLRKICADLNRRVLEKKRSENRVLPASAVKSEYEQASFVLRRGSNVFEIIIDGSEPFNPRGSFFDILDGYAAETGIKPKTVTRLFNYLFPEDDFNLQFEWDKNSCVYVYYIPPEHHREIYGRLKKICGELNCKINEKLTKDRKYRTIDREPPPGY